MTGPDRRSPLSEGIGWASKITALGFVFAFPPLAGYFVDRSFGSNPIGILLGMIVGFGLGMLQLLLLARGEKKPD